MIDYDFCYSESVFVVKTPISVQEVQKKHNHFFKKMVKIVVDVEQELIALDADLHVDLEQTLLENEGSKQENLWGANLYFDPPKLLEFNSLINIRPSQGNKSIDIQNPELQAKIKKIVEKLIL